MAAAPKVGELATQVETLSSIISVKYLGMDVPIYRFKQPSRLNPAELPFKITLVRRVQPLVAAQAVCTAVLRLLSSFFLVCMGG